jgi:hypothetical protein
MPHIATIANESAAVLIMPFVLSTPAPDVGRRRRDGPAPAAVTGAPAIVSAIASSRDRVVR